MHLTTFHASQEIEINGIPWGYPSGEMVFGQGMILGSGIIITSEGIMKGLGYLTDAHVELFVHDLQADDFVVPENNILYLIGGLINSADLTINGIRIPLFSYVFYGGQTLHYLGDSDGFFIGYLKPFN